MQKIRYRLVYNRKKKLNRQGAALVQVEAKLNQRNAYFTTNIYLRPEHWDKNTSQIVNHPQATELNAMLFEFLIRLQGIELAYWKRGVQPTLALLRDAVKKKSTATISFTEFAKHTIEHSERSERTKTNMRGTLTALRTFRPGFDFADLTYAFLRDFETWLCGQGKKPNTVSKHLRQLRTLTNEAINRGYMSADEYPFRKFCIKSVKSEHRFLTPDELHKLEMLRPAGERHAHVLDAFLFCCYTGLRYSDFCGLNSSQIVLINRSKWLCLKMRKTSVDIRLPLELLFGGKALGILSKYPSIENFACIPPNSDTNKLLSELGALAGIRKRFTYHASRHTCATLLVHQGVPITTVQKILGHTSVKTTQIYSEVLPDTIVRDLKGVRRRMAV